MNRSWIYIKSRWLNIRLVADEGIKWENSIIYKKIKLWLLFIVDDVEGENLKNLKKKCNF